MSTNILSLRALAGGYTVKEGTAISLGAKVKRVAGGKISVGRNCEIHDGAMLLSYGGSIEIGDDCTVNPYSILYGHGGLKIGNGVRIAAHCTIIPSNHNFADRSVDIRLQGLTNLGITIEDDVWIGTGVRILDGVTIAKGCIVAAGAVVTQSTSPYTIVGGVPSRKLKDRP